MTDAGPEAVDRRVLILAPTGKDAALARSILGKVGIDAHVCESAADLCCEEALGAGSLLVAEESLDAAGRQALATLLAAQPPWSDLPILILTRPGAGSARVSEAVANLGNVTLLERPVRIATLVSAVRVALRARERQYELRGRVETQALLAAIVSSSDDAIISKTLRGIVLTWNAGAERIFGHTQAETIGGPITIIVPNDRLEEERMILDRLVRGEPIEHFETVRVHKSGRLIDVSLTISPIRDATGRIIGASKVARDITPQKVAEQALREADRRKDEFLATLAHELRNPLAPIRNSLQILRLSGKAEPEIEHVREVMDRQVNHMVRLVDDLMEVSRITRGKIELRKERVQLADLVRSAIETSQPLLEAAGHSLSVTLPPDPLILHADPVRLAQVFANLLNNAAKYTLESGQIDLVVRKEGPNVAVRIRDNGIGIPSEMLSRVFEIFTQLDSSHRRSQGGLGIGLTLVRSLVQMHGGTVAAMSDGPGKGSTFVVRLPLAEGVPGMARPARVTSAVAPIRVLIVDDNLDAGESLGALLTCLGADARVTRDGPSALREISTFSPALVLLDIGMPGMDGLEVARRIRLQPGMQKIKLVALTGWGQDEDRRLSRAAGFDTHLVKPTDIATLEALMVSVAREAASA